VRADVRQEVLGLLAMVRDKKEAKKFVEKFEKTGTLSKRDVKILRELARGKVLVAA